MVIADKLKKTNRAEYLLYMWQVEDLIRSFDCDIDRISDQYINRFQLSDEVRNSMIEWYGNLCEMMRSEGKAQQGHLRLCMNILQELEELHAQLVISPHFPYYHEMYYKVLPYIVELFSKEKQNNFNRENESELSKCFDLLYGVMLLRLQKKEISPNTSQAVKDISTLVGQLSDYYFKDKEAPLQF